MPTGEQRGAGGGLRLTIRREREVLDPDRGVRFGRDHRRSGQCLDIAMRRAVVNALDFLQDDLGMERAVAYAHLSAAKSHFPF